MWKIMRYQLGLTFHQNYCWAVLVKNYRHLCGQWRLSLTDDSSFVKQLINLRQRLPRYTYCIYNLTPEFIMSHQVEFKRCFNDRDIIKYFIQNAPVWFCQPLSNLYFDFDRFPLNNGRELIAFSATKKSLIQSKLRLLEAAGFKNNALIPRSVIIMNFVKQLGLLDDDPAAILLMTEQTISLLIAQKSRSIYFHQEYYKNHHALIIEQQRAAIYRALQFYYGQDNAFFLKKIHLLYHGEEITAPSFLFNGEIQYINLLEICSFQPFKNLSSEFYLSLCAALWRST